MKPCRGLPRAISKIIYRGCCVKHRRQASSRLCCFQTIPKAMVDVEYRHHGQPNPGRAFAPGASKHLGLMLIVRRYETRWRWLLAQSREVRLGAAFATSADKVQQVQSFQFLPVTAELQAQLLTCKLQSAIYRLDVVAGGKPGSICEFAYFRPSLLHRVLAQRYVHMYVVASTASIPLACWL